jgi:hypothetical protein
MTTTAPKSCMYDTTTLVNDLSLFDPFNSTQFTRTDLDINKQWQIFFFHMADKLKR